MTTKYQNRMTPYSDQGMQFEQQYRMRQKFSDPKYFTDEYELWNNYAKNHIYENRDVISRHERHQVINLPPKGVLRPLKNMPMPPSDTHPPEKKQHMHLSQQYLQEIKNRSIEYDVTEDERGYDDEKITVSMQKTSHPSVDVDGRDSTNYASVLKAGRNNWIEEFGVPTNIKPMIKPNILQDWMEDNEPTSAFVDKGFRVPKYFDNRADYIVRDENIPLRSIASLKQDFYDNVKYKKIKKMHLSKLSYQGHNRIEELDENVTVHMEHNDNNNHFSKAEEDNGPTVTEIYDDDDYNEDEDENEETVVQVVTNKKQQIPMALSIEGARFQKEQTVNSYDERARFQKEQTVNNYDERARFEKEQTVNNYDERARFEKEQTVNDERVMTNKMKKLSKDNMDEMERISYDERERIEMEERYDDFKRWGFGRYSTCIIY